MKEKAKVLYVTKGKTKTLYLNFLAQHYDIEIVDISNENLGVGGLKTNYLIIDDILYNQKENQENKRRK